MNRSRDHRCSTMMGGRGHPKKCEVGAWRRAILVRAEIVPPGEEWVEGGGVGVSAVDVGGKLSITGWVALIFPILRTYR